MKRDAGLTLVEVLIALVLVGIAFVAMALVQTNNLRMTTNARLTTEVKTAANQVLESVMSEVLDTTPDPTVVPGGRRFAFNDFYWSCPTHLTPPSGVTIPLRPACTGTRTFGDVSVDFAVSGDSGVTGEGVLTVAVTATHTRGGQQLTLGDKVTCYDVYPSPTSLAPQPCPTPTAAGGGRP